MAPTLNFSIFYFLVLGICTGAIEANGIHGTGCEVLTRRYPSQTFFPGSSEYMNGTTAVWSQTCFLQSTCVFEPKSAADVAGALQILQATNTQFAVRSGGHLAKPGSNGITDGVLISMVQFQTMQLVDGSKTAQLGAGLRWGAVYGWLAPHGLGIAGGRFGDVGVPGLLLGGGINWVGSQYGWAFNNIRNYEVVLASGAIVNANSSSHSDLFWALKGGSSNFGIVTRFDIATYEVTDIYGGLAEYVYTPGNYDQYVHAVANYLAPYGGSDNAMSAIDPITIITPSTGEFLYANYFFHRGSDPAPAAFANFTNIPPAFTDVNMRPNLAAFQVASFLLSPFFNLTPLLL